MKYDLVVWDDVGTSISPSVAARAGMGGSEFEAMQLATELARRGKHVLVASRVHDNDGYREVFRGGGDVTFTNVAHTSSIETGTLIVHRYSSFPTFIRSAEHIFVLSTDIGGHVYEKFGPMLTDFRFTLICLSQVHAAQYPSEWNKIVLPYMLPQTTMLDVARDPDKYIYASSKVKGLHPTLEMWSRIKYPGAQLHVYSPGYEPLTSNEVEIDPSIVFKGSVPTSKLMEEMQSFAGMFFVNTYPEMWGVAPALAEAAGCRMHILYKGNPGALPEVLSSTLPTTSEDLFIARFAAERKSLSPQPPPRDWSIDRWIPSWERVLFPM